MSDPERDSSAGEGRFHALVTGARDRATVERARFAALVARYEHRPVLDVVLRTYRRDREVAGTVVGSAIAFRLFLFFVPLLLFAVGVAGFLSRWIDADDVAEGAGVVGEVGEQIRYAFEQPGSTRWVAALVGLFGMALAGRTLSKVMMAASALSWRLPVSFKASLRVVGAFVGLIVGVALLALIVNRLRAEFGLGVTGVSFIAVFGAYTIAWLAIGSMLPRATRDPGALLPGALLVAATTTGMQLVSQLYLPSRMDRASELYGAVGTTIVTLGWFFIIGRAIVISMSLNAVIFERYGSISRFVFALPLVRILPRKSAWIRRFFGLDDVPPD